MYLRDRKPEDERNRSAANSVAQSFRSPPGSSSFFDNRSILLRANETVASNAGVIQKYEKIGVNEDVQQDVDNGGGPVNYAWKAKFTIRLPTRPKDEQVVNCSIKLSTNANKSEVAAWNFLTQKEWNDKFAIKYLGKIYPIRVSLKKVRRKADQTVNAVRSKESSSGGGFGTEDMGEWGTNDTSEIPHEVGAGQFTPNQVIGVVGDSHLVGFCIAHPKLGGAYPILDHITFTRSTCVNEVPRVSRRHLLIFSRSEDNESSGWVSGSKIGCSRSKSQTA